MMLSVFGDAIVALLLVATIAYAAVLNARLGVLRGDRAKLEELVRGLTLAAERAEAGIAGLKTAADDMGRRLEKKIEEGRGLYEDLSYMHDRGIAIADRLEGKIRAKRDSAPPEPAGERKREPKLDLTPRPPVVAEPAAETAGTARAGAPSRSERELLRALGGR